VLYIVEGSGVGQTNNNNLLSKNEIKELLKEALGWAQLAKGMINQAVRKNQYMLSYKDDGSPVTSIDVKVEKMLRNQISKSFSTHGIIGEELRACFISPI
jgi:fructose-1,6-bisphosphatase/inositol monophosphatase family enzyme